MACDAVPKVFLDAPLAAHLTVTPSCQKAIFLPIDDVVSVTPQVFLDDPLAALDANVAATVVERALLGGAMARRTRVIVSSRRVLAAVQEAHLRVTHSC